MTNQTKNITIRKITGISLIVLTALLCVAFAWQAIELYESGGYTPERVGKRLMAMLLPSVLWLACLIAAVVIYSVYPVETQKVKGAVNPFTQLKRISARLPKDVWSEEERVLKKNSLLLWLITGAAVLISFVFPIAYLVNPQHFNYTDTNTEMVEAVKHTLPFIVFAFAAVVIAYLLQQIFLKSAIVKAKHLTAQAAKEGTLKKDVDLALKAGWLDNPKTLWIIRGVIIAVSLFLIVFGIANDGFESVWAKAVALCMECVGLA